MATPKLFHDYPLEYTELLLRAMNKPIRIPFPNKLQAQRFRNHIYAFRKSIAEGLSGEGIPDDLVIIAPLIRFKIDSTSVIVYHPKRSAKIGKALEHAKDRKDVEVDNVLGES